MMTMIINISIMQIPCDYVQMALQINIQERGGNAWLQYTTTMNILPLFHRASQNSRGADEPNWASLYVCFIDYWLFYFPIFLLFV